MGWICRPCNITVLSGPAPCPKCGKPGPTTRLRAESEAARRNEKDAKIAALQEELKMLTKHLTTILAKLEYNQLEFLPIDLKEWWRQFSIDSGRNSEHCLCITSPLDGGQPDIRITADRRRKWCETCGYTFNYTRDKNDA